MGQSKGGGYQKLPSVTGAQSDFMNQLLPMALQALQNSQQGFAQFLPGGGGGQAISDQANKNFQQNTIPSILSAFGDNVKGSSSLNNALAQGGANLNTDLASMLSQLQLQAAQGAGGLALNAGQQGLQPQFAYQQKQQPLWQSLLLQGINSGGKVAGGALGGWNG